MDVTPQSATILSFIILSLVAAALIFLISNAKTTEKLFYRGYRKRAEKIQLDMKDDPALSWNQRGKALRLADRNKMVGDPQSTWWYLGFGFHKAARWFSRERVVRDESRGPGRRCEKLGRRSWLQTGTTQDGGGQ